MTRVLSVLTAMMLAVVATVAAQTFPDKPIRVIMPFPADVQLRAALLARGAEPVASPPEASRSMSRARSSAG